MSKGGLRVCKKAVVMSKRGNDAAGMSVCVGTSSHRSVLQKGGANISYRSKQICGANSLYLEGEEESIVSLHEDCKIEVTACRSDCFMDHSRCDAVNGNEMGLRFATARKVPKL